MATTKIETQVIKVIKEKDVYAVSVEIAENSKGEPCISVNSRSDNPETAVSVAVNKYKDAVERIRGKK